MKVSNAFVGARGVDSLPFSQGGTRLQADALKVAGIDFFVGYLGVIDKTRLQYLLDAGVSFMPVTLAAKYDGPSAVRQCQALGLPKGCTVWLDLEGLAAWNTDPALLMQALTGWANAVASAGYMPGLYVGCPQPLSSKELYAMPFVRYWWGLGRCVDRTGSLAEPTCGWSMIQLFHGQKSGMTWPGTNVFVDVNAICADYKCRVPVWVTD